MVHLGALFLAVFLKKLFVLYVNGNDIDEAEEKSGSFLIDLIYVTGQAAVFTVCFMAVMKYLRPKLIPRSSSSISVSTQDVERMPCQDFCHNAQEFTIRKTRSGLVYGLHLR